MSLFSHELVQAALQKRVEDLPPIDLASVVWDACLLLDEPFDPTHFYEVIERYPPAPYMTWMQWLETIHDIIHAKT